MGEILAKLEEYYINYHKEKIFSIELREEFRDGRSFKILFTYEKKMKSKSLFRISRNIYLITFIMEIC